MTFRMLAQSDVLTRFWRYVMPEPMSGCWLWIGSRSENGYGSFRSGGQKQRHMTAHRFSYELNTGTEVPAGMQLDHLCRVSSCVNPRHLQPVTPRENVRRAPFQPAAINARKTHCDSGHEFNESNTYYTRQGARNCRVCSNAHHRRYYRIKKARQR